MDILLGLLNHMDQGHDDIIFFADEGGSWQVGVDWPKVLPVWFKVLSVTAEPEEWDRWQYRSRIRAVSESSRPHPRGMLRSCRAWVPTR